MQAHQVGTRRNVIERRLRRAGCTGNYRRRLTRKVGDSAAQVDAVRDVPARHQVEIVVPANAGNSRGRVEHSGDIAHRIDVSPSHSHGHRYRRDRVAQRRQRVPGRHGRRGGQVDRDRAGVIEPGCAGYLLDLVLIDPRQHAVEVHLAGARSPAEIRQTPVPIQLQIDA